MKTRLKSTSLIHILSICFVFAFFVNCSRTDIPFKKSPSQIEDDDNDGGNDDDNDGGNDDDNNDGNNDDNDDDNNNDNNDDNNDGNDDDNNDGNNDDNDDDNNNDNNNDNNDGNDDDNNDGNNDDNNDENDYNFSERSESPPNLKHIVDQIAQQCPEQMQALSDGQEWTGNLDFLDLVVEALRKEDKRWGYTFWDGHIWSSDMIGYYRGTGDPNGSNDIVILDYFIGKSGVQRTDWLITTYEQTKEDWPNSEGEWRYPRPGATVSLSDCSGASQED